MTVFAGVRRNVQFSPNHRANDGSIFSLVAKELKDFGCQVNEYSENDLLDNKVTEPNIFTMAKSKKAVKILQSYEDEGRYIINSGFGIENCYRTNMTNGIVKNNLPFPESRIVDTGINADEHFMALGEKNFWIKRGDFHAIHKEDVTFVRTGAEGNEILAEYSARGIDEAVISKHLFGDLVKFYGVRGTGFFYWFYPFEHNHIKFNYGPINNTTAHYHFDMLQLEKIADEAARVLNVSIYGGDAIISNQGEISIIDLNDWPSFAPCRQNASKAIAKCIYENAKRHVSPFIEV